MTIFTFIAIERYPGKKSRSVKLPAPSLVKIIEIYRKKSHFLYSICKVTEKLTTLQLCLKNFNGSFRNSYLLIRYMCSYMWCVFRFASVKNVNITCGRVLFSLKLRKDPDCKTHRISLYIVLCNNISRVLTPWSCKGSSLIFASNRKQIYVN